MSAVIQDPAAGDALRRAEQAAADAERARAEADRIRAAQAARTS
ncbi:hypothetical protein ACFQ7A_04970 [Streptomyces sp. NPDC056528]